MASRTSAHSPPPFPGLPELSISPTPPPMVGAGLRPCRPTMGAELHRRFGRSGRHTLSSALPTSCSLGCCLASPPPHPLTKSLWKGRRAAHASGPCACDGLEAEPFVRLGLDLDLPLERGLALSWPIRLTESLRIKALMSSGSPTIHTCGMRDLSPLSLRTWNPYASTQREAPIASTNCYARA